MTSSLPPLFVFSDDWNRHPSSSQHLIRHLLDRFEVYWINTIGMRKPQWDLATVSRSFEKIRSWIRPQRGSEGRTDGPRVLNPRMWPSFSSVSDRKLNRVLLSWQLRSTIESLATPPMVITTLPIVEGLMGFLPVQRWVYYCTDDYGHWPGCDQKAQREMEERLVRRADVLIAVSENLQDKLARFGRKPYLLTHGVDLDFWKNGISTANGALPELQGLQRPLIVFWGLIDRKMDVSFIKQLSADLSEGTLVMVGPEIDPDPALYSTPRLVHLPPFPFARLPQLAKAADVLIMPYADIPVIRASQPLKLKEYLAAGKPAVVRDVPANRAWSDCLDLVGTAEEFSQAVRLRLRVGLPEQQKLARQRLIHESWAQKAQTLERLALQAQPNVHVHAGRE
jgi:glycosyltransferase involved in cell wall biosynthesis